MPLTNAYQEAIQSLLTAMCQLSMRYCEPRVQVAAAAVVSRHPLTLQEGAAMCVTAVWTDRTAQAQYEECARVIAALQDIERHDGKA